MTRHGTVLGTPGYMAPEQASGEIGEVGPTADVYALGGILWYLLSGEHPSAEPAAHVPPLSGAVPARLIAISTKARAAAPADRYESVELLSADIRRFLEGSAVGAYRETLWDRLGRLAHRHRVAILLVLAYLLLRAALIFFARL